jgi:fibronectin-binding autotransporter adhesin
MKTRFPVLFAPFIAITMVQSTFADVGTWSGAANGTWNISDTNWTGLVAGTPWDVINGPTNTAIFNTTSLAAVLGGGTVNTNGITFSTGGSLSGGTINMVGSSPTISVATGQKGVMFDGSLSGSGGLIKTGPGILEFGASGGGVNVAFTGDNSIIDVQGGVLRHDFGNSNWNNNRAGLNVAAGAVFDVWQVAVFVDELTGAGSINKGWFDNSVFTIGNNNGSGTFSGVIHNSSNLGYNSNNGGTLALVKAGSGTQILTGVNLYQGSTTINGGTLQLSGGGALSSSTAVSVARGATFDVGSRTLTIAGLSGAGSVTNTTGTLTIDKASGLDIFSGVISGTANLVKTGAGAVSLSGLNTYTGATTINGGVLGVRKSSTSGITVAAAGGLGLAVGVGDSYYTTADVDSLWSGSLTGVTIDSTSLVGIDTTAGDVSYTTPNSNLSRGFAKLGINTLTLTGTNAYTGGTTVHGGVLSFASTAARPVTGTVTVGVAGGLALAVGGAGFFSTTDVDSLWAGTLSGVTNAAPSTVGIDTTQGDLTYTTPASNLSRGFAKVGTGTLTLTGANAYTGGTFVGAGKLILQNTKTGGQNFVTNGDLEFNLTSGEQRLQGGSITGTGNLIKSGGSTLQLGNNNNPYTIALTGASSIIDVQGGILKNDWSNSAWTNNKAGLNIASGASFNVHDGNATVDELTGAGTVAKGISNAGTLTIGVNDGTGTFSGTLSGFTLALLKQGAGTQTLSGSTTYQGGTTVNGGRLIFTNTKSGTSNFVTNAELEFNVTTGNQTLSGGIISGTGNLIKTGAGQLWLGSFGPTAQTMALTGATSIIDVQAGILRNEYGNSAWGGNRAGLTVASGATFDIWDGNATVDELNGAGTIQKGFSGAGTLTIGANDGSGSFSGSITNPQGTLALVKQGTGTQTLSGSSTYTGATSINAGKLVVAGSIGNTAVSVSNNGTILASDASASIGGSLAINSGAILAAGDANAAGTITVGGVTTFNNSSIFSWDVNTAGTDYDKLVTTSVAAEVAAGDAVFRIVIADSSFANSFWATDRTWTDIFTTNGSASIDNWASVFGNTVSVVNSTFGNITPTAGTFSLTGSTLTWSAVPEPSSALVGLLVGAGFLRRRRMAKTY